MLVTKLTAAFHHEYVEKAEATSPTTAVGLARRSDVRIEISLSGRPVGKLDSISLTRESTPPLASIDV